MDIRLYWKEIACVAVGISLLAVSNIFIAQVVPVLVPILNVIGGLITAVPPTLSFYSGYKTGKEVEEQFILFIRDLTDSLNSGMTLPLALSHCSKNDYTSLNKHINDLSSQVDWGIPFEKALGNMSKRIKSVPVRRAIATIIETYKIGGNIPDTLSSVSRSLVTIEKLKKERSSAVRSQVVTSYMIYFVFIFILIVMQSFLMPSLTVQQPSGIGITQSSSISMGSAISNDIFIIFILIQGFFAGLATGKMSEGSIVSGIKHSIFLMLAGYSLFSIATQISFTL